MEARLARAALIAFAAFLSLGASHRTQNFIVTAGSPQVSAAVAQAAEQYRKQLAMEWLGKELPNWRQPCPIQVHVGAQYGAGGATSFSFNGREPVNWSMTIHGSYERVLDSVLPHEITHTVFATHFGRPLPRWADEGACTTVEHFSERSKQQDLLIRFLTSERGIPFNSMFTMTEYPRDMIPLYSQGHSVARYLIMHGGKRKFVQYVWDGMGLSDPKYARMHYTQTPSKQEMIQLWTAATKKHYGTEDLSELQLTWLEWVKRGRPEIQNTPETLLASSQQTAGQMSTLADYEPSSDAATSAGTSPSQPKSRQVADDGWYNQRAKQADVPRSDEIVASTDQSAGEDTSLSYQPGSIRGAPQITTGVSRPQTPRQPKQTILEWSRGQQIPPARTTQGDPVNYGGPIRR